MPSENAVHTSGQICVVLRHGKGCLDGIQFFHSRFQAQTHTQLGLFFFDHHTRLPVLCQQTTPHTHTHHHTHSHTHIYTLSPPTSPPTVQNYTAEMLFVYDPLKKDLQNTAANIKEKCWSCLGSGLFLGWGGGSHANMCVCVYVWEGKGSRARQKGGIWTILYSVSFLPHPPLFTSLLHPPPPPTPTLSPSPVPFHQQVV